MYKLVLDMMDASKSYVYEETNDYTRIKLTVHHDIDLARELVDYLNSEDINKKSV